MGELPNFLKLRQDADAAVGRSVRRLDRLRRARRRRLTKRLRSEALSAQRALLRLFSKRYASTPEV